MPYITDLEKAGIPTVLVDLEDQASMVKDWALMYGVPNIRTLHASRTAPGEVDADALVGPIMDALTRPLTAKEKERGRWDPPNQQRVLFEGTLEEAEEFYNKAEFIGHPVNAPIAVYTDGFPVRIPTEERVQEMLKGTSHKPEEVIAYQSDRKRRFGYLSSSRFGGGEVIQRKKGEEVLFSPMYFTATVEKVAINAVMAGCKPEYLPVVLAIAESGCPISTTHSLGQAVCVSGPIVKEIGMNTGCGALGGGNPANSTIGRTFELMARNLGGAIPGVNRMSTLSSPFSDGGTCFAENADGLPPGWEGLNEEYGYKKNESVIVVWGGAHGIEHQGFRPGGYRSLQRSGHGGLARRLNVKGTPGPHNWLEYLLPRLWACREGGYTFVMVPEMALHLQEYGFKTKKEVYEWLWKKSFEPLKDYRLRSGPDVETNGWMGIEPVSGKHWKELPDDYMVPAAGYDPMSNCIIVAGGDEEASEQMGGREAGSNSVYNVDAWR